MSPQSSDKNNEVVWNETLCQTQSLLEVWRISQDGAAKGSGGLTIGRDLMQLSLHIISKAGFGVPMRWYNTKDAEGEKIPGKHTLTYKDALDGVLTNIYSIALMPRWLLLNLPLRSLNHALCCSKEWGDYVKELYEAKMSENEEFESGGMDLMGTLIRDIESSQMKKPSQADSLSVSEILGNTFILLLAGHESTANSIHYSLLYLALHVSQQKLLQNEVDEIFSDRPVDSWDFKTDLVKLSNGMAGAILNEELRLMAPLLFLLKRSDEDQILHVEGLDYIIAKGSRIVISTAAVHRNTAHWPSPEENPYADLEAFRPDRWFVSDDISSPFQPTKNSYIPFSVGARSCLGRRFAHTEVMAALAVIFKCYSVELAVDDSVSYEELENMSPDRKALAWSAAAEKARSKMRDVSQVVTLRMKSDEVRVRLVTRGKEIFF